MSERPDSARGRHPRDVPTESDLESGSPAPSPRPFPSGADALPLRSRARYEIFGEHARGGIGRILRAFDRELGRLVAIKELRSPGGASVERFVREAQITMRLEHPSIVPVHDAGRWESGAPFYAMKLVVGRTLKEVAEDARTTAERMRLLPNVIAVAEAMAYAHEERVVHRDLKPSNVLVGAFGETIVIDWGLAKDLSLAEGPVASEHPGGPMRSDATAIGTVVGTPSFMPPEQARGEEIDARADVYALGAILYFVLSGKAPHEGETSADVLARVRAETPVPIATLAPEVPPDLAAIVARAMARAKETRYRTAGELVEDLRRFQAGQLVQAHRYSRFELAARWVRRHRTTATASGVFVLLAAVTLLVIVVRESRLRHIAEAERDRADQKTLALLEQQGRAELASGRPFRASVLLADALRRKPESVTLRSLLTQAVRPMERLERRFVGHAHDVPFCAYSPDGARIATASTDKTARIFSATSGAAEHVLDHGAFVETVAFTPDGKRVATGASDGVVRFWDAATGALLQSVRGEETYRLAFSPDGSRLVEGTSLGALRVRDAQSGETLFAATPHTDRIQDFAFSPDGRTLAAASWDRKVSLWDLATFKPLRTLSDHEEEVSSVAFSHDGRLLVTAESDVAIHVRDAQTGARLYDIRLPEGARWPTVYFSPDDRVLYGTAHDGILRSWHATSGRLLAAVDAQVAGKLMRSAESPDGARIVTCGAGGEVSLWRTEAGYRILDFPPGRREWVYPAVFSADGSRIVAGGTGGTVAIWDAASLRVVRSFKASTESFGVATDRHGERVLVSCPNRECVTPTLWDVASAAQVGEAVGHSRRVYRMATSEDGSLVATSSYDGSVILFDAHTGAPRGTFPLGTERVPAVAFDPKGAELAATNENGKLFLVDRATGKVRRAIDAHPTWIEDVAYSPDGTRILTSGRQDHTAKVWNTATGALELTLSGHRDNLLQGRFSPDGRFIATASVDHTANVWDARSGDLLRTILGGDFTATFAPDGRELLVTGYDGYAVLWDVALDSRSAADLVDLARRRSPWVLEDGRLTLGSAPDAGAPPRATPY
jgi:WD40 repeat protein